MGVAVKACMSDLHVHDDIDEGSDKRIDVSVTIHVGTWVVGDVVHDHIDQSSNVNYIHIAVTVHITHDSGSFSFSSHRGSSSFDHRYRMRSALDHY